MSRILTLFVLLLAPTGLFAADKYALLIGVTKYENAHMNRTALRYPEADATSVGELLERSGYTVKVLLGKEATQASIKQALDVFEQQGSQNGVVFIGLFGHGVQYGEDAYFCPYDTAIRKVKLSNGDTVYKDGKPVLEPDPASMTSMKRLLEALNTAGASNRVMMADCCREDPSAARGLTGRAFGSQVRISDLGPGTAAIFSCSNGEQAFEHPDLGHGALTKAFLDYCGGLGKGSDATVSTMTTPLYRSVDSMVKTKSPGSRQRVNPITNGIVDLQISAALPDRFTNSIGIQLKLIPAGTFLMGSPSDEEGRHDDEGPRHRVTLSKSFYMGIHEVTQGQWESVMKRTPWKGENYVKEGADYAASYVSWDDATEFCRRLSQLEGKTYRLPTEAEWEYARRAGTSTRFHFGDSDSTLSNYGWFDKNAWYVDEKYAHMVGQKRANDFGLYDMHGNVWEWCSDWKGEYSSAAQTNPPGPSSGSSRVLRGGSWVSEPFYVRSAFRYVNTPGSRNDDIGFRVVSESE